jgi:type II secretory pathway component GspD/PulD (secretin)
MASAQRSIRLVILAALVVVVSAFPAKAWQKRVLRTAGNAVQVVEGEASPGAQPGAPGQPNPMPGAKPADGSKPDDPNKPKEGEKKKEGPSPITTRPVKPQKPADPDELKNLKPDAEGRVKFNLKGQPWPDVLDWLAETSQKSLDWQELPNDYLNLVTQQSYSIDEARDMLNRHLLSRGFTMLTHGETISVVSVSKINPGMVPRVEPDELATLPDHDYVKTSFPLAWLLADQAETELKPMLSPNGKLTHLTNTNRLEAMDSVKNLREVWTVIQEEQSGGKQEQLVREFKLKHTKAAEVLDQLHVLLGINKPNSQKKRSSSGGGGGMDPNMMMQFQQQMQQMMQQMQQGMQQAQGAGGAAKAKPGEVRLLANERENSILATAPPDKMAIVSQAVKTLDVQATQEHLLQNLQRMQVYRLSGIDPQSLVDLLDEVGNLDPTTKLQIDGKNKSIVAYASLADHLTIKMLVEKLDGTGRKFQVIPLRKLAADYVAGTIEFMMAGGEKDKNQGRSNPFYFDYGYMPYGMGRSSQTDSNDKFRVDADVENNRLLLWANDIEVREIENLLMKLGEIAPPGGNRNTLRTLDSLDPEDSEKLLERIRRIWPGISPNELIIDDASPSSRSRRPEPTESPEISAPRNESSEKKPAAKTKGSKAASPKKTTPASARAATQPKPHEVLFAVAETTDEEVTSDSPTRDPEETQPRQSRQRADAAPLERPRPQTPAPVRIRRGPDGRLVLESQDTEALDRLEELLHEAAPPKRDYKVFYLKHSTTWAYSVELSLKDFFEEDKKKSGSNNFNPFYGYRMGGDSSQDSSRRLSKRKALKFISDSDSGTIIVQGADAQQLKIIEELINIYDQPLATDGKQVRKTQIFTLKYSKATTIAEAIKDVYRDLLSTNDKAYQNQQGKEGQKPPERNYTFVYGNAESSDKSKQETPIKFKGLVSLGVDDISNTIIVSAPESLLENIEQLIEQLDRAARPTNSVQVVKLDGKVNSTDLQKRLQKIFTKPQQKPQQQRPQQPQQPQQQPQEQPEEPIILP